MTLPDKKACRFTAVKKSSTLHDMCLDYPGKKSPEVILQTPKKIYRSCITYHGGINRIYFDDNLPVLATLLSDMAVKDNVRMVYIDPPFASSASYRARNNNIAYDDFLSGSAYIEALRERLIFLHRLLAPDGSLYLHLDVRMIFHMRVILDEIFGNDNFRGFITRKKCNPKNFTRRSYGNISDYILFYSKSRHYVWNRPFEPWDDSQAKREFPYIDELGRRYKKVPIHAPGERNGKTGQPWRGMYPPPGKHWQLTPEKLEELDSRGDIYWSSTGNPRRKVYLENSSGLLVQNIWLNLPDVINQNTKTTGYPTEKNADLLSRIIEASTNTGDLVLDCYSGSGTTLEVADRLGRRWIGVDSSKEAINTTINRLTVEEKVCSQSKVKQQELPLHPKERSGFSLLKPGQ